MMLTQPIKEEKKRLIKCTIFHPWDANINHHFFVLFCSAQYFVKLENYWQYAVHDYEDMLLQGTIFLLRVPLVHRSWKATWQSMLHHPDAVKRTEATCTEVYGLWFRAERPFSGNPKAWDHKEVTADNFTFLQHWDWWFLGSHLETSLRLSVNCVTCKRRKWSRQEPSSPERS